jgi:ATP-dependent helicase HrpA
VLDLSTSELIREGVTGVSATQFPDRWTSGSFEVDLSYEFDPGAASDGVTVTVPLPLLATATAAVITRCG